MWVYETCQPICMDTICMCSLYATIAWSVFVARHFGTPQAAQRSSSSLSKKQAVPSGQAIPVYFKCVLSACVCAWTPPCKNVLTSLHTYTKSMSSIGLPDLILTLRLLAWRQESLWSKLKAMTTKWEDGESKRQSHLAWPQLTAAHLLDKLKKKFWGHLKLQLLSYKYTEQFSFSNRMLFQRFTPKILAVGVNQGCGASLCVAVCVFVTNKVPQGCLGHLGIAVRS